SRSRLAEIVPKERLGMIDLVKAAGVDVSDWSNSKRGRAGAAMNPKYCYEWSFVEPRRVVVLNIWHHAMKENDGGIIIRDMNMRAFASERLEPERTRALKMDAAMQTAMNGGLPVRVIVLAGKRRGDPDGPLEGPS